MAYCIKCGAKVDDGQKFCSYCGAEIPNLAGNTGSSTPDSAQSYTYYQENTGEQQPYQEYSYSNDYSNNYNDDYSNDYGDYFEITEVKKNKAMGVLSYLGILVLIPLLAGDKRSAYVRHHANQGLILFVISSVIDFLDGQWVWGFHSWINAGGGWFSWLFEIADFACLILFIMGIVSACKGTRRELPFIGKIKILK